MHIKAVSAEQQGVVAIPVEHEPFDGRFVVALGGLRVRAEGHIAADGRILRRCAARPDGKNGEAWRALSHGKCSPSSLSCEGNHTPYFPPV